MIRQTRIFVSLNSPFNRANWVETVLGCIIKPVVQQNNSLNWYWFSRYYCTKEQDSGDCDITKIPNSFIVPPAIYKSVRLRYSIQDDQVQSFERSLQDLISTNNCTISDFRFYNVVEDLGSNRHIGGDRSDSRRGQRADLLARLYWSISKLALDALDGPDTTGGFVFEQNDSPLETGIVLGSSFEIPHHVFCNITNVPTRVLVNQFGEVGTDFDWPRNPIVGARQVRF